MAKSRTSKAQSESVSEEERSRQHSRFLFVWGNIFRLFRYAIIGVAAWAIVYTGVYLPIKESAGKETIVNVVQKWIFDAQLNVYVAWGLAGAAALYARSERRKRLRERRDRDNRIAELEKRIDPGRTSSGLTVEGEAKDQQK